MSFSPRPISDDMYILTAVPNLQRDADGTNRLKYINFIATNAYDSHTWVVANKGGMVIDFAYLLDAGTAQIMFERLCEGETVTFPSFFSLKVLRDRLDG